jgi:2-polyprenyl-6-methoxyphenol hydroxylase-like FAD-dependent oxidoreductase
VKDIWMAELLSSFRFAIGCPNFFSPTGRGVLIGDAAHTLPPSGGQSGAMALEDAEALAHTLATFQEQPYRVSWTTLLEKW